MDIIDLTRVDTMHSMSETINNHNCHNGSDFDWFDISTLDDKEIVTNLKISAYRKEENELESDLIRLMIK